MPSIADCLQKSAGLVAVSDTARLDCEILLCHVLQQSRTYLYTWPEKSVTEEQWRTFSSLFQRRASGEPVAYLVGTREFWSLPLRVEPSTLIPRPETELIVALALQQLPIRDRLQSVLDLGTGTGAIALALASECRQWQLQGVDKFDAVIELAEANRRALSLDNVTFYQSDWFDSIPDQRFHLIVANPPYIDANDVHLNQGDVQFEPRTALVADHQGMADLEAIIESAPVYLHSGGWLILEHGYQQAQAVQQCLHLRGFIHCQSHCDLAGHMRATMGQWFQGDLQFSDKELLS